MMIGPAPMMRMVEMSVRFGMRSSRRATLGGRRAICSFGRTKKGRAAGLVAAMRPLCDAPEGPGGAQPR